MRRLFRERKTSVDSSSKPVVSGPVPLTPSSSETPLFARFSTVHRGPGQDGQAKPVVSGPVRLSSKPSNSSFSVKSGRAGDTEQRQRHVLSRVPSRVVIEQQKELACPPPRSTSRNPLTPTAERAVDSKTRTAPSSSETFPSFQGSFHDGLDPLPNYGFREETLPWIESRYGGAIMYPDLAILGSESYSPPTPPRQLVVRNLDPDAQSEVSHIPPEIEVARNQDQQVNSMPFATDYNAASSTTHLAAGRLLTTGFALEDEHTRVSQSTSEFISDARPGVTTSSSYSPVGFPQSPYRAEQDDRHANVPSTLSTGQTKSFSRPFPLLQPTPSVTRRKYSLLAAFGLPTPQVPSGSDFSPSSTSTQSQKVSSSADADTQVSSSEGNYHVTGPGPTINSVQTAPGPLGPEHPNITLEINSSRKFSSPVIEAESHATPRGYSAVLPPLSANPHFNSESSLLQYEVDQSSTPGTPAASKRSAASTRSLPMAMPYNNNHSSSSQALYPMDVLSSPGSESLSPIPNRREEMDSTFEGNAGPLPRKSHRSRTHRNQHQTEGATSSGSLPAQIESNGSGDRAGPVRGRPLIFAAMESAEDIEDIPDIEPEVVGMIGNVSLQAKSEEGYHAYAYSNPQLATPPPEPLPQIEPQSRKLSKHRKHSSGRKVEVSAASVDIAGKQTQMLPQMSTAHMFPSTEPNKPSGSRHHRITSTSAPSIPQLESPFNMQEDSRYPHSDVDRRNSKKKASHDGRLHRRTKDGVRPLTEKQMEKLGHRASYAGSDSVAAKSHSDVARRSFVEDKPLPSPPVPGANSHKSSRVIAPLHAAQSARPTSFAEPGTSPPTEVPGRHTEVPDDQRTNAAAEQVQIHSSTPQLPTPADEHVPVRSRRHEKNRDETTKRRQDIVYGMVHGLPAGKSPGLEPLLPPKHTHYPLTKHLSTLPLLEILLGCLSYYEFANLSGVSKDVRRLLFEDGREQVLERYLRTVGYSKWHWKQPEPLVLNVDDLRSYMRGVSIPSYRYAELGSISLQPQAFVDTRIVQDLAASCRAFTRVVLRLRAHAEAEAAHNAQIADHAKNSSFVSLPSIPLRNDPPPSNRLPPKWSRTSSRGSVSRSSSRAPSPSPSLSYTHSRSQTLPKANYSPSFISAFQSPLFRLRRAPLLQVFVPSPEGDWLSDTSILECEAELKRAGVLHLLRAGDVVWDTAVGDEGNIGRLVWDGSYLIDLDYTYSRAGDPPRYLPTLAFPPSYFHRVIRTMGTGNPIVHIDVSAWADQIKANLQLLQDRTKTETPQGGRHTVVRWVNRSSFTIRPAPGSKSIRIPMPRSSGPGPSPTGAWMVDPDWFGTVIIEVEGTNEGLADLRARCQGPLPSRTGVDRGYTDQWMTVWRIVRERSRPGEIWIRAVTDKERLVPL